MFDRVQMGESDGYWTTQARGQAKVRGSNTIFALKLTIIRDPNAGTHIVLQLYQSGANLDAPAEAVYQASGEIVDGAVTLATQ
jgi:hypothetical protein